VTSTANEQQLLDVARRALRLETATESLADAIRDARSAGHSLRAIAKASGMSHENVRRLTQ